MDIELQDFGNEGDRGARDDNDGMEETNVSGDWEDEWVNNTDRVDEKTDGTRVEFTNEDLPADPNRPDLQLVNRRRCNLVYCDVDDMFGDVLGLEDDTRNPAS